MWNMDEYTSLGYTLSTDGDVEMDVNMRLAKAAAAF